MLVVLSNRFSFEGRLLIIDVDVDFAAFVHPGVFPQKTPEQIFEISSAAHF
jgi:hypothetical protein